jgi:hypothetical protein
MPVAASSAGSSVECPCGQSVPVPRLSDLRDAAGQRRFETNTIDTVRRMIAEGTLPPSRECMLSGQTTDDIARIYVECERIWSRESGRKGWTFIFTAFFLPFWWLWIILSARMLDQRPEDFGRNTEVSIPIRVCREQQSRLRHMGSWELSELLRRIPIYAKLLDEYRGAKLSVE